MNKKPESSAADIAAQLNQGKRPVTENEHEAEIDSGNDADAPTQALEHPKYEELEAKLTEAEAAINDYKMQLARSLAEMENVRRRAEKDITNAHKFALEKFVQELLTIADNLERGLSVDVADNELAKRVHEGMEMTLNQFLKILEKFSVKQINPVGESFNPELHQAISMLEDPSAAPNTILQVLQKGYVLHDRLVRPALVVVAKG